MEEIGTYEVTKICKNCGKKERINIPQGTSLKDYNKKNECIRCRC